MLKFEIGTSIRNNINNRYLLPFCFVFFKFLHVSLVSGAVVVYKPHYTGPPFLFFYRLFSPSPLLGSISPPPQITSVLFIIISNYYGIRMTSQTPIYRKLAYHVGDLSLHWRQSSCYVFDFFFLVEPEPV